MMTCTGLPEWSAPEMLRGEKYSNKIDMWSIGCVLYFVIFGQKPFEVPNTAKLNQLIQKGKIRIPENSVASKRVIKLIKRLLCVN